VISHKLPHASRRRHRGHVDRGAAAVEMAIVLPLLLFVLFGMIDLGRAYSAQIQLSQAAREGVRLASLNTTGSSDPNYGASAIQTRVTSAAGSLGTFGPCGGSNAVCVTYCPNPAAATDTATVVVTAQFTWITGISGMSRFFGDAFSGPTSLTSTGVMRCIG
jgi:Flp pilus assembly protein TadG